MVVDTVSIGNVTIRVHDDCYKNKTKEEMQEIINRCCQIEIEAMLRKRSTKEKTA